MEKTEESSPQSGYYFCPSCGNLLLIDTATTPIQLKCRSCNFKMAFQGNHRTKSHLLAPLNVESFVVSDNAMNFSNKTEILCENPECGHNEAYYKEIQIRSADEPATIFYCCCKCRHRWRDG